MDVAPKMARIAAANAQLQLTIRVLCHDIEILPTADRYECCVVYNTFHKFLDPAKSIVHLVRGHLMMAHGIR